MVMLIKATRAQFGHKNGKILKYHNKNRNNCMIKHQLKVPCASFKETCVQTRTTSNTPFRSLSCPWDGKGIYLSFHTFLAY